MYIHSCSSFVWLVWIIIPRCENVVNKIDDTWVQELVTDIAEKIADEIEVSEADIDARYEENAKEVRKSLKVVGKVKEDWNKGYETYAGFIMDMEDLIEEEEELWKQYCMWEEEQSRKRISFNRRSCTNLIKQAMRYERFISMGAPEIVITEEGRCLAEEMVLYYFGKEEPIVWD